MTSPIVAVFGRHAPRIGTVLLQVVLILCWGRAPAQMLTPGEFSVSAGGAATYQIKLRVPHGIGGLVPELALHYNSQGGNGITGAGWSLSGLSVITRCPQSRAQDGPAWAGGVNFTAADRYCLDGQRLIAVPDPAAANSSAGVYGADGTYYATEVESFSRVQSLGNVGSGLAANGTALYGPSSFIVKTKSGLTMEYGATLDSQVRPLGRTVVASWALTRVTDTKGNYMVVSYNAPDLANGQSYPLSIQYTGNASVSPAVAPASRVDFEYDTSRPDQVPVFAGGSLIRNTVRLTKVLMSSAGVAVREYRLTYRPAAATARSAVQSIQECSSASINTCLPAMTFDWLYPATGWQVAGWSQGASPGVPVENQCVNADFNGDGRADIACYSGANGDWDVLLSTGNGWSRSGWPGGASPASPVGGQCVTGDFNGDGRSDLACYNGTSAWHITFSTGSGWQSATWSGPNPGVPVSSQCVTGDYNADGKTDLACFTGSNGLWHVALSTGTSWNAVYWGGGPNPGTPVHGQCMSGDFDGDGRTDMACFTGSGGTWHVALSQGTGWSSSFWSGGTNPGVPVNDRCSTGDFNGDGKTDIACYTGTSGSWHVSLSQGGGSWYSPYWTGGPDVRNPIWDQCRVGDFNGDGKTDFACQANLYGDWLVALSTGLGWSASGWSQGPVAGDRVGDLCVTGDFTGDGKTDLACYTGANGNWVMVSPAATPNLLVNRISRPMGEVASISYKTPVQTLGERYTRNAAVATGQMAVVPGAPLVVDVDIPNGIGGTRRSSYWYDTAVAEPESGRGFLGFKSQKHVDVATGISTVTSFSQVFPTNGQPESVVTATAEGLSLTQTATSFVCRDPATALATACAMAPGRRYFIYPEMATARSWDLTGAAMPWSRTTHQSPDAYGNFQTVLTDTLDPNGASTEHRKVVTSNYFNDPAAWLLGRLRWTKVESYGPTVPGPVLPGSGNLPPAPQPQLPPNAAVLSVLPVILQLMLED